MMQDSLKDGAAWGFPGEKVVEVETHAARVFLVGDRAFKMKKPVRLPYLDFSTVGQRRAALQHELEINRLFVDGLYLGLIEKSGEPVLVMRRFPKEDELQHLVGQGPLPDQLSEALAHMAATAHRAAPPVSRDGAAVMQGLHDQLARAFVSSPGIFPQADARRFDLAHQRRLDRLAPLLRQRANDGLLRRCHGDMHCANIVLLEGKPALFDAIEFDDRIAEIDVLYDLAFLLMDLLRHGQDRAANIVLNRYVDERRSEDTPAGLAALPLFLATRAGVRALVRADLVRQHADEQREAERREALAYFHRGLAFLDPAPPRLVAIGGLSGTGKSTLARSLAPFLPPAPGAIHVRTDIERKRLAGVGELERLPAEAYAPEMAEKVYRAVLERAGEVLRAGHSVIVDAVFAVPQERRDAESLARRLCAGFEGIWLDADPATMKSRVTARRGDASDATADVVDRQLVYDLGEISWHRIDASGAPDRTLTLARRALDLEGG
jgi:hypothetical protein